MRVAQYLVLRVVVGSDVPKFEMSGLNGGSSYACQAPLFLLLTVTVALKDSNLS